MKRHQTDTIRFVQSVDITGQCRLFQKTAEPVRFLILLVPKGNLGQGGGGFFLVKRLVELTNLGEEFLLLFEMGIALSVSKGVDVDEE